MPNCIQHICKNPLCKAIFIDYEPYLDCINVQMYKYCEECVKNGFKNPEKIEKGIKNNV